MLNSRKIFRRRKAQTAIEYMLLLAVVVTVVLIMLKRNLFVDVVQGTANVYYDQVVNGILGAPNRCGDGVCASYENCEKCPLECPSGSNGVDCP